MGIRHVITLRLILVTGTALAVSAAMLTRLHAAEVKLLTAEVMKPALADLAGAFETSTGHKLTIEAGSAGKIRARIEASEPADVAIIQKPALEALSQKGKIVPASIVPIGRSGIAMAVPKGSPKPDISSVDSLKRSLLDAKSIAYPDPTIGAASGVLFKSVLEKLGIALEVNAKAKFMPSTLAEFAAKDHADIVVIQPMDILAEPTYELVGWLPAELQDYKNFTWAAAVTTNASQADAAKALVQFLSSPTAAKVFKKRGMESAQ